MWLVMFFVVNLYFFIIVFFGVEVLKWLIVRMFFLRLVNLFYLKFDFILIVRCFVMFGGSMLFLYLVDCFLKWF